MRTRDERNEPGVQMTVQEAASYWFMRKDCGDLSDAEGRSFERWLAEDGEHRTAFQKQQAAWDLFDGHETSETLQRLRHDAKRDRQSFAEPANSNAPRWYAAGIAASLVLIAGLAMLLWNGGAQQGHGAVEPQIAQVQDPVADAVQAFETERGGLETVTLADGSIVTLNTDSAIEVAYSADRRTVALLRGQALFDVAHDPDKPFVVRAGNQEITALGTRFDVRLDSGQVQVALMEGRVAVTEVGVRPGGAALDSVILEPGQELIAVAGKRSRIEKVQVAQQLRWTQGFVEFDDVPLKDAISELNRYNMRQIVIRDGSIASMRVSGVFKTDDPARFAAIVGELLPVESRDDGDTLVIAARR